MAAGVLAGAAVPGIHREDVPRRKRRDNARRVRQGQRRRACDQGRAASAAGRWRGHLFEWERDRPQQHDLLGHHERHLGFIDGEWRGRKHIFRNAAQQSTVGQWQECSRGRDSSVQCHQLGHQLRSRADRRVSSLSGAAFLYPAARKPDGFGRRYRDISGDRRWYARSALSLALWCHYDRTFFKGDPDPGAHERSGDEFWRLFRSGKQSGRPGRGNQRCGALDGAGGFRRRSHAGRLGKCLWAES